MKVVLSAFLFSSWISVAVSEAPLTPGPTTGPTPGPTPGPTQDPAKRVCVGKGWGDPHMVTFDGLKFNAQTRGEVIVSTSLQDPGYMIQGRFVPTNRGKLNKMTGTFAHNVCCCI